MFPSILEGNKSAYRELNGKLLYLPFLIYK